MNVWCSTQQQPKPTVRANLEFIKSSLHCHNLYFIISFNIIFHLLHKDSLFVLVAHVWGEMKRRSVLTF
jgi:hypothetical protein